MEQTGLRDVFGADPTLVITIVVSIVVGIAVILIVFRSRKDTAQQASKPSASSATSKDSAQDSASASKKKQQQKSKEASSSTKAPKAVAAKNDALLVTTLKGFEGRITTFQWHPKGSYLAAFADDRTLRLFFPEKGAAKPTFRQQRINTEMDYAVRATFSSDGNYILALMDGTQHINAYALKKEKDKVVAKMVKDFPIQHTKEVVALCMAGDKFILTADEGGTVILRGLQGKVLEQFDIKKMRNNMAAITQDNKFFTVATGTGELALMETLAKKGTPTWEFDKTVKSLIVSAHKTAVNWVSFNGDSSRMATGSNDCTWKIWDLNVRYNVGEEAKLLREVRMETKVDQVAIAPDNSAVAVIAGDRLYFYGPSGDTPAAVIPHPHDGARVLPLSWAPNSNTLATAGEGSRGVKLWKNPLK